MPPKTYYRKNGNGEHSMEDKMKRLKKAIDEKSMKVLDFTQMDIENQLMYKILGSTGTFYDVIFSKEKMSCTCPDHDRHKSYCKHIYLVYIKIFHLIPDLEATGNAITEMQYILMKNAHEKFMEGYKKKMEENEKHKDKMKGYRFHKEDECSICFDIFGDLPVFGCKTCKNCFHDHCMTTILKYNPKCPMCRSSISKSDKEEDVDEEVDELAKRIKNTILDSSHFTR